MSGNQVLIKCSQCDHRVYMTCARHQAETQFPSSFHVLNSPYPLWTSIWVTSLEEPSLTVPVMSCFLSILFCPPLITRPIVCLNACLSVLPVESLLEQKSHPLSHSYGYVSRASLSAGSLGTLWYLSVCVRRRVTERMNEWMEQRTELSWPQKPWAEQE